MVQNVTLLTRVRDMPGSNRVRDTKYTFRSYPDFPQSFQVNTKIHPDITPQTNASFYIIPKSLFSAIRILKAIYTVWQIRPVPVAARSKTSGWGRSLAGIVGLNPAEDMDVCLLGLLCFARLTPMRRADHSTRGVIPTVVRPMRLIVNPRQRRP